MMPLLQRLLLLIALVNVAIFCYGTDKSKPVRDMVTTYPAKQFEGFIGTSEETPLDNPVDNIFHINVDQSLSKNQQVWLVYELDGVQDHTHVSRSINDQLAVGGYVIKRRRGWAIQREQINAEWLKKGDNVIRFTIPVASEHFYKVRNIRLEVSSGQEEDKELVFNQPSFHYYFNKAYIKGFVNGATEHVQIKVAGQPARIFRGEFESIIDANVLKDNCYVQVEATFADGTTKCYSLKFEEPVQSDYEFSLEHYTYKREEFIEAGSESQVILNGASFHSLKETLEQSSVISITTLRSIDLPALDAGMVNVTATHAGFRFLPHGKIFKKEALVKIPFDKTAIPDGYTEKDIRTYYFDETSHHWVPLTIDSVLMENGEVWSKTLHFTDMINGIIKVPESPEVNAYNSTSMKGIKAANPTAAVNLINPPQANNTGSASLGYPINIPAGRNGMQPQLSVSYNSGGGNGWMGLGWNLQIPSITIETRWGVPRYDASKETETYLLNGEQLTPVAHRGELQDRYPSGKRFYPRVEGAFNKIERFGDKPWNYYWVVTDKSGTKYFYGAEATGFDESAVLTDNEDNVSGRPKNIAHWALREVRDLNGNTVKYYYSKQPDSGVTGGETGYQIYIERITYTGFSGSDGPYSILFHRDRNIISGWKQRKDLSISGNLGFKQVTGDLLSKIEIMFNKEHIRSYNFYYKEGEFSKTLLSYITETDKQRIEKFRHDFDYYNDFRQNEIAKPFKDSVRWELKSEGVDGGLIVSKLGFTDEASALSANKSTDFGGGFTVSVGIYDNKATEKSNTIGGSTGYNESVTKGKLMMIDVNGDGLPDKVIADENGFRYYPNLSANGETRYSYTPITMREVGEIYHDKSKSNSYGFEAQGGSNAFSAFVGTGANFTTTVTSVYFNDVNGDQLPDLVKNGVVYFNQLNRSNGEITFSKSSDNTPNPIRSGVNVAGDIFEIDPQEQLDNIKNNPLHDMVRVWRAPFTGTISINAPVTLLDSAKGKENADGVQVSIQHNDNEPRWKQRIPANDFTTYSPQNVSNLAVNKGDRIYFRVQSIFNGEGDVVQWSPVIRYLNVDDFKDANNKSTYVYDINKDFVLTAPLEVAMPIKGKIRLEASLYKPQTTDSLLIEIVKKNATGQSIIFSKHAAWNESGNIAISGDYEVEKGETFLFRATSLTNIDWSSLKWRPTLYYTRSDDDGVPEVVRDGKPLLKYYGVPYYSIFARPLDFTIPVVVKDSVDSVGITPALSFKPPVFPNISEYNGEVMFSVKKRDTLLLKMPLIVHEGLVLGAKKVFIPVHVGDSLYAEYHFNDQQSLSKGIINHAAIISTDKDSTFVAGVYTTYPDKRDFIFGTLYRQWGQFAYNGNLERADQKIHESDLKYNSKLENPYQGGSVTSTDGLASSDPYSPSRENFIILIPHGSQEVYNGYDQYTYLNGIVMSSARMGDDDVAPVVAVPGSGNGTVIRAINKISKSSTYSLSGGASFTKVGNGSANTSTGTSKVLTDFMDMNGDRYPDVVSEKGIQFTLPTGELERNYKAVVSGEISKSTTSSAGASAGGFVKIKPKGTNTNQKTEKSDAGNAKNSGVISVNYGEGWNGGNESWHDMNGDGLPDKVREDGAVKLNYGYRLGAWENWGFDAIQKSHSTSTGGGLGFSIGVGSESSSIAGGIGLSRSDNDGTRSFLDINGDGLIDELVDDGAVKVRLNKGNGFTEASFTTWTGAKEITASSTVGESANVAFTGCIPIPLTAVTLKLCFNPSFNGGRSISRDKIQISDFDGDGFPDYVTSFGNDGTLNVKSSTIARTNLLKFVKRPLGASFTMNYRQLGNTFEMPQSTWVLDSVKVFDGFKGDGVDNMLTSFEYEGGYHDRHERDFYGFSKVITKSHNTAEDNKVYTTVTQTFKNDNYYEKGLMVSEVMTDGDGKKYVEKTNEYELKDIFTGAKLTDAIKTNDAGNAFPALTSTVQKFYEGSTEAGKSTSMSYAYDALGNITTFKDLGDEGDADDITAVIDYHKLEDKYIIGTPKSIEVKGGDATYRKREAEIDPNTGDVKKIKQYLDDENIAVHDLDYDDYGNLKEITRPANAKGQRMKFTYEYDTEVHTYTTKVSNSYGYSSEATYDYKFAQVLTTKDLNGNEIVYELDDLGRVINITGPYEKGGANKTIQFEYHPEATVPWALTKHFDPSDPKNTLNTVIFVDGLGRVLQTKKDVALFDGEGKPDVEKMTVSGRVFFDAFGRTIRAHYPTVASAEPSTWGTFIMEEDGITPTTTTYDVLNRTLNVTLPDQSVTSTEYGFGQDREGKQQFMTATTDANGKKTEQFTDVKGRVTAVKNYLKDEAVWTSFKYNVMSEQVEATDDLGHTTYSQYDKFGRRTERRHPDAGTTSYKYDLAGNLTELITANLLKEGLAITYTYDYERLTDITYPQNPENNVKYTYGEAGATDNRAGRIVLQEDATGAQEFFYGPLGEVVKNIRTIIIPQFDDQTYTTEWKYDTWNRLTSMTYADGEVVTYNYNQGGLLRSMSGKKKNSSYAYVNQLGYDKFEQRVYLAYGNGTKTTYNYEPDRRRLKTMTAQTSAKRLFMDNVYEYDKVNNILSLKNNAPIPSANLMGGASEYTYNYDDLYRLTTAQGNYKGANEEHSYTLSMAYNTVGGITNKTQVHKRKEVEVKKTSYNLNYTYGETQPHAPIHIGEQTYSYDANGNQTGWTSDVTGQRRNIIWDEENRIRGIYDNGALYHYTYDASGERVLKGQSTGQRIFVNGEWKAGSGQMGNYTVYVNPYIVLKSGGYTKHYYIEGQRIVSKLGGGWDNNGKGPLKAGEGKVDYAGRGQKVFDGIVKNLKFLGADGQILTAGKSGKIPPGQINGTGGGGTVTEAFRYFYHPDHLGSTSYVTDASGEVYQHLEYTAWGETLVEEHSNTDRTPYLFNGKELDEETGLYYYGARYYDPRSSIFISVDPSAERYPGISAYAYAFNNPIALNDPDGRDPKPKTKAIITSFTSQAVAEEISRQGGLTPQPGRMQPSMEAIQVTISYEALSLTMYDVDGSKNGNATIGFGHKIHDGPINKSDTEGQFKDGITFSGAVELLIEDIAAINTTLSNRVKNRGLDGNMTQGEYDTAFDLEYNTGNSTAYLKKLSKIKELESKGSTEKASEKRNDLTKWLEKQYPGKEKKRGVSRMLMNEGSYVEKGSLLNEVEIKGERIKE